MSSTINKINLLVVAPEFPLINQPWMDTYLEQLIINDINFRVFSLNKSPEKYQAKVDDLNLLSRTDSYQFDKFTILYAIIKKIRIVRSIRMFNRLRNSGILKTLSSFRLLLYILYFYSIREKYADVDIIHSHSESVSHRFIVLSEIIGAPLVLTFHGLPPRGVPQLNPEKRRELYEYAKKIIVNTSFAKSQVLRFGCSSEKIKILPQGLPLKDFPFNPCPPPLDDKPLQILSVGRFHRDKGQHYSLLALKRLLNSGIPTYWTFVGSGPDLAYLEDLVHKLEIDEYVTFYERASSEQLLELYSQSHIFVLASIDTPGGHVETQGVVLQEAQASGCLVIATRTGGIPECLTHNYDSVLVDPQSSRAISSAITYFYLNRKQWKTYRQRGLENVKKNFSSDVIGREMARFLREN